METGTVIAWNEAGGYGFIEPDLGGRQVFVHCTQARLKLAKGVHVQFNTKTTHRGLSAHDVVEVEQAA